MFDEANKLLSESFGYHIDPDNGLYLRQWLQVNGWKRFVNAVAITENELEAGEIENDCQEIHAVLELHLFHLRKTKPGEYAAAKWRRHTPVAASG